MKRYQLLKDTPAFKAGTECYIDEAGNMVPCRGISYTIVHKYQLEKNPNILADWFEEIKESTRWKPEMGCKYYFLDSNGFVYNNIWADDSVDHDRFEIGNCFQTEEEAERAVEYLKALTTVRGDATTEFTKDISNWYVYNDVSHNYLYVSSNSYCLKDGIFGLPYFATKDDALRSIETHKKEWLTIFGIEDEE